MSPPTSPELNGVSVGQKRPRSPDDDGDGDADGTGADAAPDNTGVPKTKRLACKICRKRKLKCDGVKPSCSTCTRLGHPCAYDEVRKKSGPKRGYVKALEERLKQVETLLNKTQESTAGSSSTAAAGANPGRGIAMSLNTNVSGRAPVQPVAPNLGVPSPSLQVPGGDGDMNGWQFNGESPQPAAGLDDFSNLSGMSMGMNNVGSSFAWDMIGLGLEEPLPPQETIDELHQIYFEKVHPSLPMIHKYRYLAAMNLGPNQRPPVCLRYALWTLACSITDKYTDLKDLFYQRARKYVEADYIKGYGEHMISVAHAQAHILLASYEFKMMYFPRAWMNTGAAIRLCQMIGLHRLDGAGLDVKQSLPPPRDWTEREERRRTFWMAFCEDRYASIGTGWPMTIDEKDIMTNLPSTDEAFDMSRPEQTQMLPECMNPAGAAKLSSFGSIVLMACLFGRNLIHLHRPDVDDRDNDLNGEFWKRHRSMDNILLNTSLCLPPHLKLPIGLTNPNIIFANMSIHTSTICLHQAAIFKADKNKLPASVSAESKVRCITAANEIASIMRMVSHMDLSSMNPFISFCLYVAARVFVQYLKSRPDDSQTADALRFLLSAMNALRRRNALTESFLVQLDVDLEALGLRIPKLRTAFPRSTDSPDKGCVDHDGLGIMVYRNECHYMKDPEDDGNAAAAPEIVEPSPEVDSATTSAGLTQQSGFADQSWPGGDAQLSMPGPAMTPRSGGSIYDRSGSRSGDNNLTGSPDGDRSGRPTPNSSVATSDQRGGNGGGTANLASANNGGSGGSGSFGTSPIPDGHNVNGQGGLEEGGGTGGNGRGNNGGSLYPDPGQFPMGGTAMTPGRYPMGESSEGFGLTPEGWQGMQGQAGMTPMSEGVLRSLINMGPMDAMDLGNWNNGNG